MTIKISVITAVYKKESLIDNCVMSVLNQSYTDFEYILVNDGSPDRCPEICDEYSKADSRVKVIHRENGGHAEAYNSGINSAQGEYILLVDADDSLFRTDALANMLHVAVQHKCDIVLSDFLQVWGAHNPPKLLVSTGVDMLAYLVEDNIYHPTTRARLFKQNLLKQVGPFKDLICDDEEWTPRAFYQAETIAIYPRNIYLRTTPEDSVTMVRTESNYLRKATDRAQASSNLLQFFSQKPLTSDYKCLLFKRFVALYLSSLYIYVENVFLAKNKSQLKVTLLENKWILGYLRYTKNFNHRFIYIIYKLFGFHAVLMLFKVFSKFRNSNDH